MQLIKRLKESFLKNRTVFLIAGVLIICLVLVSVIKLRGHIPDYVTYTGYADEEQFIYYLSNEDVLIQEFSSPHDFDFATVHFSDHEKVIDGKTFIKLEDTETNVILGSYEYDNKNIHHTEPVRIEFPKGGVKNHSYRITISFEGFTDISLGIYAHCADDSINPSCEGIHVPADGEDTINLSDYAIAVGTHSNTNAFYGLIGWIVGLLCLFIGWNVYVLFKEKWPVEKKFLAIVIPMGVFFLSFFSHNAVHDGMVHMAVTYHYSNVFMNNESDNFPEEMTVYSDEIPIVKYYKDGVNYHVDSVLLSRWYEVVENIGFRNSDVRLMKTDNFANTTNHNIIEYLPAVIAITLSRLLHLSAVTGVLLAKIFMFVCYVIGVYLAIKISPAYKTLIAFIGLIPMNMYQATGVTYDTIITVVCILLFALYVKAHTTPLMIKDIVTIGVLCLVLGLSKGGIYLIIPLTFILIPKYENDSGNSKLKTIIVGVAGGFIGLIPIIKSFIANYLSRISEDAGRIVSYSESGEEIHAYTLRFILENPIDTIKIVVNSVFNSWDKMVGQAIGNRMCWTDLETNWLIIGSFIILLIIATIKTKDEKDVSLTVGEKVFIALMFAVEFGVLNLIMLISETKVGDVAIRGVQGRYFLPWAAFLLILFGNRHFTVDNMGRNKISFCYGMVLAVYGLSFLCIFMNV